MRHLTAVLVASVLHAIAPSNPMMGTPGLAQAAVPGHNYSVYGTVRNQVGEPVSGCWVMIWRGRPGQSELLFATSTVNGSFAVSGLPAGRVVIEFVDATRWGRLDSRYADVGLDLGGSGLSKVRVDVRLRSFSS